MADPIGATHASFPQPQNPDGSDATSKLAFLMKANQATKGQYMKDDMAVAKGMDDRITRNK